MRDIAEWIRGTLASRREAKLPRPTERSINHDGTPNQAAGILFVGSTTEPGPFGEGGTFDAESGTSRKRGQMKNKRGDGLAAIYRKSPAANEEFTGMVKALAGVALPHSGWNPYEVWRTRVMGSSTVMQEREPHID
jgi:hypothetical protein